MQHRAYVPWAVWLESMIWRQLISFHFIMEIILKYSTARTLLLSY